MPDTIAFLLQLNLSGYKGYHCPLDEEGFLQFAKDLPSPTIYEAIRHAKPVSDISAYRNTGNFRRLFEKAPPPNGLCVVGDAVCSFNPIHVSLSASKSNKQMRLRNSNQMLRMLWRARMLILLFIGSLSWHCEVTAVQGHVICRSSACVSPVTLYACLSSAANSGSGFAAVSRTAH